jgi:type II secretory pathway pseudopilin PulG
MKLRRTAGFTILELTIAMLLSAIVIGITYTVWTLIGKTHHAFVQKNDALALALRVDELVRKDFERSNIVLRDTGGIAFITGGRVTHYEFDTGFVVRKSLRTDSFKVRAVSFRTFFENKLIEHTEEVADSSRIDQLDLSIFVGHREITYHYHKLYSSADLIPIKQYADH